MNYTHNSYISIFDQIESIIPNQKEFCFEKYTDSYIGNNLSILKQGYCYYQNSYALEIKRRKTILTCDFLLKFSGANEDHPSKIIYLRNPRIHLIDDSSLKLLFPIYAIQLQGYQGNLIIYFLSIQERDEWFEEFKKVGILSNISDYFTQKLPLGKGTFAKVSVGTCNKTHKKYAIKAINKYKIFYKNNSIIALSNEINVLRKINHPNIIKLFYVFEGIKNVYLILEYVKGGELYSYIKNSNKLIEEDVKMIMSGLIDALEYIHRNNIIHRDLKLENILLRDKSDILDIKIVDFGLATFIDQNKTLTMKCGSPGYIG